MNDTIMSDEKKQSPLCLSALSSPVLAVLARESKMTYQSIAEIIVKDICRAYDGDKDNKTTRRRVYDVLHIFSGACILSRDDKYIELNKNMPYKYSGPSLNDMKVFNHDESDALNSKRKSLALKLQYLAMIYLLIERNQKSFCSCRKTMFPCIFIGFKDTSNGRVTRLLSGQSLTVETSSPPRFFSPKDVMQKMGFTGIDMLRVLSVNKKLKNMLREVKNEILTV